MFFLFVFFCHPLPRFEPLIKGPCAFLSLQTYSIWASSCKTKTECNEMHPYISVVQVQKVSCDPP